MNDKDFLNYFEQLKSSNQELSVRASDNIIKTLLADSHVTKKDEENKSSKTEQSKFGKNVSQELQYALKRLINGTISTNPQSQLNYSFTLSQIFKLNKQSLEPRSIIELVMEKSNKKQAINKTEINMFAIGRVYILKSIAQSQIIESKPDSDKILDYVFEILIQDFQNYDFLKEMILEVFKIFLESKVSFKHKVKLLVNKGKFLLKEHNLIAIQYLAIVFQACEKNSTQFSYEQNLKDQVFNHKNLIKALEQEVQNFPNKSAGYKYIISTMFNGIKDTPERKKEIWEDFFKNLLKELNKGEEHKNFFVILQLLQQYVKQGKLEDLQNILISDLIHLWLRNLNSLNKNLQKVSQKVESKIVKLLKNVNKEEFNQEQQNIIVNFLNLIKSQSSYNFSPKSRLAQAIFQSLNEQHIIDYYKNLKKQLHKATDPIDRKYYINEIYVVAEICYEQLSEELFLEISFLLFEQSTESKLKYNFNRIPEEIKSEYHENVFVDQNKELILGYFFSLLAKAFNTPSKSLKDRTSKIYRGITENFGLIILKVASYIISKQECFKDNEKLTTAIENIKPFLDEAQDQEKDYRVGLKKLSRKLSSASNSSNQNNQVQEKGFTLKKKLGFLNLQAAVLIQSLVQTEEGLENLSEMSMIQKEIENHYQQQELQSQKPSKKRKLSKQLEKKQEDEEEEETPNFINVLTDLMVSLLTKSASYLRDAVNTCFSVFVDEVDEECLQKLADVICRPNEEYIYDMDNEALTQNDLIKAGNDSEMETEDDQEEEE